MKFPRWLVVSLLSASVLAVLGAGAWWWVAWPERTATLFVAFLASDQLGSAELHIEPPPPLQVEPPEGRITFEHSYVEWPVGYNKVPILDFARALVPELRLEKFGESHAIMSPRTVSDLVLGRQCFKVVPGGGGTLIAQRGRVLQQW
jgi:hypothetical protein